MGKINAGSGQVLLGAGPYVGLGLDAIQSPDNVDLYKKDKTTDKAAMHRWDFGLGVMVGYEFGIGISINAGYQAGLINTLSAEKEDRTMKNQTVSLGVGYRF
ncbi:MAG: PorT family protein [Bacteroidales bacterium]|nr:PorT family protein [Bacteroidales bacterium]